LLSETESAREVVLECNPAVQSEVEFQLSGALKEVLGARRCTVNPMDDMDPDTLKLRSTNGAEIVVSLKNIQALLQQEIERCLGTLDIVGSQA
jgi:cobyric acid synthase